MTLDAIRKFCLTFPGATEDIQWKKDRVFKIAGKMFLCMGIEKDSRYSFKVEDERFLELTDLAGVVPAPYLARARWVQIEPSECKLGTAELKKLIRKSYDLVFAKLPKKTQREVSNQ